MQMTWGLHSVLFVFGEKEQLVGVCRYEPALMRGDRGRGQEGNKLPMTQNNAKSLLPLSTSAAGGAPVSAAGFTQSHTTPCAQQFIHHICVYCTNQSGAATARRPRDDSG
uniref:Uncharacterized protein n=1 Tax=Knipowitschia caucasica TaxID=637954 RepID=A0AAV2MCL9_KNICA